MWATTRAAEKTVDAIKVRPDVGDAKAAIAGAAKVVKAEYMTQLMGHQQLEPTVFIADVRGDTCVLTGSTQFQQGAQGTAAAVLGIKPENVTVNTTLLGGGFGRRVCVDYAGQAAQISKAVGRPVKILWTREDEMKNDFYRPLGLNRLEAGLDASGKPVGIKPNPHVVFALSGKTDVRRGLAVAKADIAASRVLRHLAHVGRAARCFQAEH